MWFIRRRIGKSDFQLARHFFCIDQCQRIVSSSQRIRHHIKIFPLLDAGQRRTHRITRKISAATHDDDAIVQSLFHQRIKRICFQIVQLKRLTGRKMQSRYLMSAQHICNDLQRILFDPSRRCAQAKHTCLTAFLCIASVIAGKSFIASFIQFSRKKSLCLLLKFRELLFPLFDLCSVHGHTSFFLYDKNFVLISHSIFYFIVHYAPKRFMKTITVLRT